MEAIKRTVRKGELILEARSAGYDIHLILTGGDAHIGAVALGTYDQKNFRASSSVLTAPGHRDDVIALKGARTVSSHTHTTTAFCVGIHFDAITKADIEEIVSASEDMIDQFIEQLNHKHREEE